MTRILVTGAGGFVGSHLIKALKAKGGDEIYAAVFKATADLTSLLPADHILAGDLTDYAYAESLVKTSQPDLVYHLAAISVVQNSVQNAQRILTGNTILQYNLLEAIRQQAPKARVVAVCSANEYGLVDPADVPIKESCPLRPLNPYAVSKVNQEMLAVQYHYAYGLDIVILRPFNHTGPGQTTDFLIPKLASQVAAGNTQLQLGNLDNVRDYTDVEDMVAAYQLAAEKCQSGEIYNIGTGVGVTVSELIDLFRKVSGASLEIVQDAASVRVADVPVLVADAAKFRQITGWSPKISLEDTIMRVLAYWRKN